MRTRYACTLLWCSGAEDTYYIGHRRYSVLCCCVSDIFHVLKAINANNSSHFGTNQKFIIHAMLCFVCLVCSAYMRQVLDLFPSSNFSICSCLVPFFWDIRYNIFTIKSDMSASVYFLLPLVGCPRIFPSMTLWSRTLRRSRSTCITHASFHSFVLDTICFRLLTLAVTFALHKDGGILQTLLANEGKIPQVQSTISQGRFDWFQSR